MFKLAMRPGAVVTLALALSFLWAGTVDAGKYDQARSKFEQLKRNARQGAGNAQARFLSPGEGKRFEIDPVDNFDPNDDPYQCGIAVWFQLSDGSYVNPTKHRWNPGEKFYVWIEPAVPVSVSLHQNYPEDRPPSRQVYPDARHPETFKDFAAGSKHKLPVRFKMDDDLRDEIMSMVVVRCDSNTLPIHTSGAVSGSSSSSSGSQNSGTSGPGGTFRETQQATTRFNDEANATGKINGKNSRFDIIGPDPDDCPEISDNVQDVQFFMFGDGFHHQFQLTLKK